MISYRPGMKLYKVDGIVVTEEIIESISEEDYMQGPTSITRIKTKSGNTIDDYMQGPTSITRIKTKSGNTIDDYGNGICYHQTKNDAIKSELDILQIQSDILTTKMTTLYNRTTDIKKKADKLELMLRPNLMYHI